MLKIDSAFKIYVNYHIKLEIQDSYSNFYSSEKITERYPLDNGWQRVTLTVDISQSGWHTFVVWMMGGSGCVYADDMQLEVGAGAGSANLLHNGSFEGGVSGWSETTPVSYTHLTLPTTNFV